MVNGVHERNDFSKYVRQNPNVQQNYNTAATTKSATVTNDSYSFSSSEKCTDGKDDGKIGLFSAIGNAIKGVGKTIVNGVKGMFTDKDGNFSLGKTLLSVGTAAACIAFPAVGLAACAIGGTMGAIQVGKGIYNAATAETDAQAKEAWQSIGGGAFTVGTSVVGAKAGVKAVKTTSTAKGGLSSLGKDATLGQKAVALGKDMASSTKNQAKFYANTAKALRYDSKMTKAETQMSKAKDNMEGLKPNSRKYNKAETKYNEAKTKFTETQEKYMNIDEAARNNATSIKQAKNTATETVHGMRQKAKINRAKTKMNNAKTSAEYTKANSKFEQAKEKYTVSNKTKQNIAKFESAKEQAISAAKHPVKTAKTVLNPHNLSATAKKIWADLSNGDMTYSQAVQKYGYDNVAEVIKYAGGSLFAQDNI